MQCAAISVSRNDVKDVPQFICNLNIFLTSKSYSNNSSVAMQLLVIENYKYWLYFLVLKIFSNCAKQSTTKKASSYFSKGFLKFGNIAHVSP